MPFRPSSTRRTSRGDHQDPVDQPAQLNFLGGEGPARVDQAVEPRLAWTLERQHARGGHSEQQRQGAPGPYRRVRERPRADHRTLHLRSQGRPLHLSSHLHRSRRVHAPVHGHDSKRITAETPPDGWNNTTLRANGPGAEPIIEAWERVCVENNGPHGEVAAAPCAMSSVLDPIRDADLLCSREHLARRPLSLPEMQVRLGRRGAPGRLLLLSVW